MHLLFYYLVFCNACFSESVKLKLNSHKLQISGLFTDVIPLGVFYKKVTLFMGGGGGGQSQVIQEW